MTLVGSILKNTIELKHKLPKRKEKPFRQQVRVLKKLLKKAEFTSFGEHYNFSQTLHHANIINEFNAIQINKTVNYLFLHLGCGAGCGVRSHLG